MTTANETWSLGDGATVCVGSDRYAATVVGTTPYSVTVQFDTAVRTDDNGYGGTQEYRFERNPEGRTRRFAQRKDGKWRPVGQGRSHGEQALPGRRHYMDPHF